MTEGEGMDVLEHLSEYATALPYGLFFGLGLLLIRFLSMAIQQWNVKEDRIDKNTQSLFANQQQQIDSLLEWKNHAEKELRECRERHAASELEVARLSGILQGYGDARQLAQINAAADKVAENRGRGRKP